MKCCNCGGKVLITKEPNEQKVIWKHDGFCGRQVTCKLCAVKKHLAYLQLLDIEVAIEGSVIVLSNLDTETIKFDENDKIIN